MEIYQEQAKLFKILTHPTRLAILDILRTGEECVCHLEAALGNRQAYISQQLMVLREAGIIQDRRDGWNIYYRVTQPEIHAVVDAAYQVTGKTPDNGNLFDHRKQYENCECPKCKNGACE